MKTYTLDDMVELIVERLTDEGKAIFLGAMLKSGPRTSL